MGASKVQPKPMAQAPRSSFEHTAPRSVEPTVVENNGAFFERGNAWENGWGNSAKSRETMGKRETESLENMMTLGKRHVEKMIWLDRMVVSESYGELEGGTLMKEK